MTLRITQIILLIANFLFGTSLTAGIVYVYPVMDSFSRLFFSYLHKLNPHKTPLNKEESSEQKLLMLPLYNSIYYKQLD